MTQAEYETKMIAELKLEATHLCGNLYAVRPENQLGTCGWIEGKGWEAVYVRAASATKAVRIAEEAQRSDSRSPYYMPPGDFV